MTKDIYAFLKRNNIADITDFITKSDFKIDSLETNISSMEINGCVYCSNDRRVIPLSQILGFSKSHCKIDKSFFSNFDTFFDSDISDSYHNRAIGMLKYSPEEIMEQLSTSFNREPIKTISIEDKYYISSNGLHRFMALKLYYMLELYQGKTIEELDKKYMIEVENKDIDLFSTFTGYFGSTFNPSIACDNSVNKKEWLSKVKIRMESFSKDEYDLLVKTFAFSHFINDNSGEIMIKYLYEFFPNFSLDIFKYLVLTGNVNHTINFNNCIKKYFLNNENEFIDIINNHMKFDLEKNNFTNDFKYFDLEQQWNEYGTVKEITNIENSARDFSEGSQALENCLQIIWNQNIVTTSCCKGNHLSINVDNKPEVNCESYIAFGDNQDWQKFLSQEIIENNDVIIKERAIYYYGGNCEAFFGLLGRDFVTGKKENKSLLQNKNNNVTDELEYKSFVISLEQIGFDKEQISCLSSDYLEITKAMKEFYSTENNNKEEIIQEWQEAKKRYDEDLIFYIERNNQAISQKNNML